jgi:hypothetical protein
MPGAILTGMPAARSAPRSRACTRRSAAALAGDIAVGNTATGSTPRRASRAGWFEAHPQLLVAFKRGMWFGLIDPRDPDLRKSPDTQ